MRPRVASAIALALCALLVTPAVALGWSGHHVTLSDYDAASSVAISQNGDMTVREKKQRPDFELPQGILDWLAQKAAEISAQREDPQGDATQSQNAQDQSAQTQNGKSSAHPSSTQGTSCYNFVDRNGDGICDNSAWASCNHRHGYSAPSNSSHGCGRDVGCVDHDGDRVCDNCGYVFERSHGHHGNRHHS